MQGILNEIEDKNHSHHGNCSTKMEGSGDGAKEEASDYSEYPGESAFAAVGFAPKGTEYELGELLCIFRMLELLKI